MPAHQLVHPLEDGRSVETICNLRGDRVILDAQLVNANGVPLAALRREFAADRYLSIIPSFTAEFEVISGLSITFNLFPSDIKSLRCPAAPQYFQDAAIFGIVAGEPEHPELSPILPEPFTAAHAEAAKPATPREVYRMVGVCIKHRCLHWEPGRNGAEHDGVCTLIQRVREALPVATTSLLPICHVRSSCRWFAQEGREACQVCPGVVTDIGELPQDEASENLVRFF